MQEPIAIVGLGCRFPGAENSDEFWRVLSNGENHVIDVTPDRWNVDAWYHPDAPGKMYTRKLGLVQGHDEFDNRLYGISESESVKMDPQQRFVLDSVSMALEDGGFTREHLRGSNTGVYIGSMNADYSNILSKNVEVADNYNLTGSSTSIVAARVSYVYDLHGPAVTLDTACSSALMAIHLASQGLSTGDCDLALAGGVNLVLSHVTGVYLSQAGMASRVGQCQAFSEHADGYVRGEGCGIVILKRLSDALKNGDKIWGTIITGTNQDGRMTQPITAPSGVQQERLLEDMYRRHNIDKSTVQYIEAHGTGTPVGDPIEANCLGRFFGQDGKTRHIGSVKTNIGHLESAAGAAGLIKVLLMMKHETIVPSLLCSKLNPKIEFEKYHLKVPSDCIPWKELPSGGRAAGVNSFGFGGSNCHTYVRQYVTDSPVSTEPSENRYRMIAVSSRSSSGLKANILHLKEAAEKSHLDMDALSFTSTCRRDHHEFRLAFHAKDQQELIAKLNKTDLPEIAHPAKNVRVIYVFCGMGTAWKGMCIDLLDKEQVFSKKLEEIDRLLEGLDSISVIDELRHQSNMHDPAVEPLVLFACQVGLTTLWRHWGVEADAVIGQSVGEVAAAHAAGILSLKSAVSVIYHRTELLLQTVGGKMLVIGKCSVEKVDEICREQGSGVNVAVYNSPTSCTISGDEEAVNTVRRHLESLNLPGIIITELAVKTAYHCHKQKPLTNHLIKALNALEAQDAKLDIISTVTGHLAFASDFKTAKYWAKNLTDPVKFYQGLVNAKKEGKFNVFLEIGPRPVLRAHFRDIFSSGYSNGVAVPSLEKMSSTNTMLNNLGKLFTHGLNPRWTSVVGQGVMELTAEPKYQFQRIKSLFEPESSLLERQGLTTVNGRHPFAARVSGNVPTLEIRINESDTPFVYSHVVGGAAFVPGTFFADVAFEYATEIFETVTQDVQVSLHLLKPVSVSEGRGQTLSLVTEEQSWHSASFRVLHKNSVYVFGEIEKTGDSFDPKPFDIAAARLRCTSSMDKDEVYGRLMQFGFEYGEQLQLITKCEANSVESLAWLSVSDLVKSQMAKTHLHPSILDAAMQSTCAIYSSTESDLEDRIPSVLGEVSIYRKVTGDMMCYSRLMAQSSGQSHFRVLLLTHAGHVIAEIKDFVIKVLNTAKTSAEDLEYELQWVPTEIPTKFTDNLQGVLVFLYGKSKPNQILSELSNTIKVFSQGTTDMKATSDFLNMLFKVSTSRQMSPVDEISGVVFYADSCEKNEDIQMTSFTKSYDNLREVLSFLFHNGAGIPVSVVTVNTQLSENSPAVSQVSLDGSHLWGMMRCFLIEDNRKTQLIDLHDFSHATIDTLTKCLNPQGFQEFRFRELMIREGKPFRYLVKTSLRVMPIRERIICHSEINESLDLVKHRKSRTCSYDFRLEYSKQITDASPEREKVLVNVECVAISKRCRDESQTNSVEDQRLVCVEAIGTTRMKSENEDVIVLQPTFAKTVLTVPKVNTIPRSLIKDYKPGLLTCLAMVENMTQRIPTDSLVVVITDPQSTSFGHLVRAVLNCKGCMRVNMYEKLTDGSILSGTSHVILFSNCPVEYFITEDTDRTKEIIAVEGFGGERTLETLRLENVKFTFRIIRPSQLLDVGKTSKCLRQISMMLSTEGRRLNDILSTFEEKHLGMFISRIINLTGNKSLPVCVTEQTLFRGNASYVVVGGLTGLGWLIVQFIAEMGGGVIAIGSRRTPDKDAEDKMRKLGHKTGTNIEFLHADVCDMSSLENAILSLQTKYPDHPVKGIFQGAGVLKDSMLIYSTAEDFDQVASPKIKGSLNLHRLCLKLGLNLDYFILQSSVASVFGNPGQTCYGGANSFLDTLACYRRQKGLPGQSINWGPLCVGMAVKDETVVNSWKSAGFEAICEEGIRKCLTHALLSDKVQMCFADINVKVESASQDIRGLLDGTVHGASETQSEHFEIDLSTIKSMDEEERKLTLWNYVKDLVIRVLPVSPELLQPSTLFSALGLNSMVAVSVTNRVRSDAGIHLPATRLLSEDLTLIDIVAEIENALTRNESGPNSTTDSERVYSKLSPLVSPMQDIIYRSHRQRIGSEIEVLLATEISTTLSLPKEEIKSAVYKVLERNKPVRTVYKVNGNHVESVLLETFEVPESIVFVADKDDITQQILSTFKQPFDLRKDLPFRVIYNQSNTSSSVIRFLFHPIAFDQKAVHMFINEFIGALLSEHLPVIEDVDIPREIFKVLTPQFMRLETFWQKRLNQSNKLPLLSLSTAPEVHIRLALEETISLYCPRDVIADIIKMSQMLKITMFQILVSALHLLWHLLAGEDKIGLLVDIDTRQHVPALMNVMTHCVNYLPVVGSIDKEATIGSFLQSNSAEVRQCVEHGLYPGFLVLENMSEVAAANICRHNAVITDRKKLTHDKFKIRKIGPMGTGFETRLILWASETDKEVQLQLDYHPGIVTKSAAQTFLADYQAVLQFIIQNPNATVKNISESVPLHSVTTPSARSISEESGVSTFSETVVKPAPEIFVREGNREENNTFNPNVSPSASALSLLTAGSWYEMKIGGGCCSSSWEDVFLRLSLSNGKPGCLEWGRDEHGSVRKIAVSQIRRVSRRAKGRVHELEIKSSNKTLRFRSGDETEAVTWCATLDEMTRSRQHPKSYTNEGAVFETDIVTTHM